MTGTYIEMRLSDLIENPDNPRETLSDIDELAGSIAAVGVLQRLLVTPTDSFKYMVVDGHRRFAALQLLEWDQPARPRRLRRRPHALAHQRAVMLYDSTHRALLFRSRRAKCT